MAYIKTTYDSSGIALWMKASSGEIVCLLQESETQDKPGDMKVDPFRGMVKDGETPFHAATRKTYEESGNLFDLRGLESVLEKAPAIMGIYQVRVEFVQSEFADPAVLKRIGGENFSVLRRVVGSKLPTERIHVLTWKDRVVWNKKNHRNLVLCHASCGMPRIAYHATKMLELVAEQFARRVQVASRVVIELDISSFPVIKLIETFASGGITTFIPLPPQRTLVQYEHTSPKADVPSSPVFQAIGTATATQICSVLSINLPRALLETLSLNGQKILGYSRVQEFLEACRSRPAEAVEFLRLYAYTREVNETKTKPNEELISLWVQEKVSAPAAESFRKHRITRSMMLALLFADAEYFAPIFELNASTIQRIQAEFAKEEYLSGFASRLTAEEDESNLAELSPISGLSGTPVVTLSESVQGLDQILGNLQKEISLAYSKVRHSLGPLTLEEAAAIHLYTQETSLYKKLNAALRDANRTQVEAFFPYLKLLLTGLYKLPTVQGTVNRGIKPQKPFPLTTGKKLTWWSLSSATTSVSVLNAFLGQTGNRVLFQIEALVAVNVKNYSAMPAEDELLLLPGSYFGVSSIFDAGNGLKIVQLKQEIAPFIQIDFGHPMLTPK